METSKDTETSADKLAAKLSRTRVDTFANAVDGSCLLQTPVSGDGAIDL